MKAQHHRPHPLSALALCAIGSLALSGPAGAADAETQQKIDALQAEVNSLKAAIEAQRAAPAAAATPATAKPVAAQVDKGYLTWRSADGFELKLDGRVQLDMGAVDSEKNADVVKSDTKFRRVRLGLKSKFGSDWAGEFDLDFADNAVDTKDMWLAYTGFPNVNIQLGHFKPHFSMDQVTSSRFATFMESSIATEVFAPSRRIGLAADYSNDMMFIGGGVFGDKANTDGEARDNPSASGVSETFGYAVRAVGRPLWRGDEARAFHLGLNVMNNRPRSNAAPNNARLKYASVVENELSQVEFLDTKQIQGVDSALTVGLELALKYQQHMFTAEYLNTKLKLGGVMADMDPALAAEWPNIKAPSFKSYYAAYSYFIRGDRRYDAKTAEFAETTGNNALEVTARYSVADLNDPDAGYTRNRTSSYRATSRGVFGGKANIATVGLNWYPNPNMKFVLNYMLIDLDKDADADAGSYEYANGTVVPIVGDDKIKVLGLRAQFTF